MARIYGQSGCTDLLIQGVHKRGLRDLNTLKKITHFRDNFTSLINEVIETARNVLSVEIKSFRNTVNQLGEELKDKISNRETLLLKEKQELIKQTSNKAKSKIPKRLKVLETKFDKELKKPFKKDGKKFSKIAKKCEKMELNFDNTIKKRTNERIRQMNKSKQFIDQKASFIQGAFGEEKVIRELKKLVDSFIIFNDMRLSFSKAIRWKKYNEYVKSCQIDHVVIGPSGIFLIETKNWNPTTLQTTDFSPHKQVDRAGYIFFVKFNKFFRKFRKKIPIRSIVVTMRELPDKNYPYVKQLTPKTLLSYITQFKTELTDNEIERIAQLLIKI